MNVLYKKVCQYREKRDHIDKYQLFFLFLLNVFLIFIIGYFLNKYFPLKEYDETSIIYKESVVNESIIIVLLVYLFGAIKEELKYRLFLTKFNYDYLLFSFSLLISDIFFLNIDTIHISLIDSVFNNLWYYFLFYLVSFIFFFIFKKIFRKDFIGRLEFFFKKNIGLLIVISIITFALWHVFFTNQTNNYSVITIFGIQLINAVFFTFVRIKFGLIYSFSYHLGYNLFIYYLVMFIISI